MKSFFKRFSLIISLILCTVLNANALTINGITYKAAKSECKCGSIHVHVVGINDMQYKNNENIIVPKYIYILDKKKYHVEKINDEVLKKVKSWNAHIYFAVDDRSSFLPPLEN